MQFFSSLLSGQSLSPSHNSANKKQMQYDKNCKARSKVKVDEEEALIAEFTNFSLSGNGAGLAY